MQRWPPIQTNEMNCSPSTYAAKVLWVPGLLPGYTANWTRAVESPPPAPLKISCSAQRLYIVVTSLILKSLFSARGKVLQIQNLHELKIQNRKIHIWALLQFDGSLWGRGIFRCNTASGHSLRQLRSKAECLRSIQFLWIHPLRHIW